MKKKFLSALISLMLVCSMVIQPLTVGAGVYKISQINVNYEGMSATSNFASTYISGMGAGYLSSDSRVKVTTSSSLVPSGSGSALCVNKCDMRWWTVEAQDRNITFSVDIKIDAAFANVFTPQVISKVPSFTGNGLTTLDLFTVKRVGSSAYLCDSNGNSLKKLTCQLAKHNGTSNLKNRIHAQKRDVVQNGVSRCKPCFSRLKKVSKILKSDPRTAKDSIKIIEFFERKDNTGHRDIAHQNDNNCSRENHKPFNSVVSQVTQQWAFYFVHRATPLQSFLFTAFILTNAPSNYNGTKL